MSVCNTTGLSSEQQERWPYLYRHLTEDIEVPDLSSIELTQIKTLDEELSALIKKLVTLKQRVENHLQSTSKDYYSVVLGKMQSLKPLARL